MTREARVLTYVRGPSIWPPGFLANPANVKARRALARVLLEIPEAVYNHIEKRVSFVFDSQIGACAVSGEAIIVFKQALTLPEPELSKILAHEIGHLVLPGDHSEQDADDAARAWGFRSAR